MPRVANAQERILGTYLGDHFQAEKQALGDLWVFIAPKVQGTLNGQSTEFPTADGKKMVVAMLDSSIEAQVTSNQSILELVKAEDWGTMAFYAEAAVILSRPMGFDVRYRALPRAGAGGFEDQIPS